MSYKSVKLYSDKYHLLAVRARLPLDVKSGEAGKAPLMMSTGDAHTISIFHLADTALSFLLAGLESFSCVFCFLLLLLLLLFTRNLEEAITGV